MAINVPSASQQLGPLWALQLKLLEKKGQRANDLAKVIEGVGEVGETWGKAKNTREMRDKFSKVTTTLEDGTELNLWDLMKGKNATEVASAVKSWSLLKAKNEDELRLAELELSSKDGIGEATGAATRAVDAAAQAYRRKYEGGPPEETDSILEEAGEGFSIEATKDLDDKVKSRRGPGDPPLLSYKRLAPLERIKV